ncbi:hypothetical protein QBC39DRAFT_348423 [Podospora conica]|nr:hypothetical protein QBC39DRAFT_348423 [Schizothecium conicum]
MWPSSEQTLYVLGPAREAARALWISWQGLAVVLRWVLAIAASLDGLAPIREMATLLASRTVILVTFVGRMSDLTATFAPALRASTFGMRRVIACKVILVHRLRRDRLATLIVKLVVRRLVYRAADNSHGGFLVGLGVHAVKIVGIGASLACVRCSKHAAV